MHTTTTAKVSASSTTTHYAHLDAQGRVVALECGQRGGRHGLGTARKANAHLASCVKCQASAIHAERVAIPAP